MTVFRPPRCVAALVALLLACALPRSGTAQSLWTKPYEPNQLTLEFLQPALDTAPDEELSLLTGAAIFGGSYLINDRTTFVAEVPIAHYRAEVDGDDPTSITETALGNPYLGMGISSTRMPLLFELGGRLPAASSDHSAAMRAGTTADLDRSEMFAPDLFSAHLLANARWELSWRTTSVRLRGGPLLTVPTQDNGSTELYARYGIQGWREGERYVLGLGLTGRALLTGDGSFADRTTHQVGGTLIFNFPRVQPGILARVPLNGPESDAVNLVVGVTLSVSL